MIFHKDTGFPPGLALPTGRLALTHSRHALDRASEKGFVIPKFVTLKRFDIIEALVFRGRVEKILIRGRHDDENDICIAIRILRDCNVVKTAWLNHKDDLHNTLDTSNYVRL